MRSQKSSTKAAQAVRAHFSHMRRSSEVVETKSFTLLQKRVHSSFPHIILKPKPICPCLNRLKKPTRSASKRNKMKS